MSIIGRALGFMIGGAVYPSSPTTHNYTGSDQSYVVPAGVTFVRIKSWGAGAHGSNFSDYPSGGAGQYSYIEIPVTAGETLTVVVGGAGTQGGSASGPYGGGGDCVVNAGDGGAGSNGGGGGGKGTTANASTGAGASGVKRSSTWLARGGGGGGGSGTGGANRKGWGGGTYPNGDGAGATDAIFANGGSGIGDILTVGEDGQPAAAALPGNSGDSDNGGKGYGGGVGAATSGRVVIY